MADKRLDQLDMPARDLAQRSIAWMDRCWDEAAGLFRVPDDARPHFLAFGGECQVERVITTEPRRVATAWIGAQIMLGAEDSGSRHRGNEQFHPATIHWLAADDAVGCVRPRHTAPVDARAERGRLSIHCTAHAGGDLEFVFQIAAPAIDLGALQHDRWELPSLTVRVETNATGPAVTRAGDLVELRYSVPNSHAGEPVHFTLWM